MKIESGLVNSLRNENQRLKMKVKMLEGQIKQLELHDLEDRFEKSREEQYE